MSHSSCHAAVPRGPIRVRLAERAVTSVDSVVRIYRGIGSEHMRERVRRAAIELGVEPPPPPPPAPHEAAQ